MACQRDIDVMGIHRVKGRAKELGREDDTGVIADNGGCDCVR